MRAAQARGVAVQVITHSLPDSDEPLVSLAYCQPDIGPAPPWWHGLKRGLLSHPIPNDLL